MKKALLFFLLLSSLTTFGQGRKFLKDKIREWNECKNVAMTLTGGDIALKGKNGWAASGAPVSMTNKLSQLNDRNELIDDVVLTESGSWLILWGNNGVSSYGCPSSLDYKIKQWKRLHNGQVGNPYDVTLMTYIRNTIHHPDNNNNLPYTETELENSIKTMIGILQTP